MVAYKRNGFPPEDPGIVRPSRIGIEIVGAGVLEEAVTAGIAYSIKNCLVVPLSEDEKILIVPEELDPFTDANALLILYPTPAPAAAEGPVRIVTILVGDVYDESAVVAVAVE